MFNILSSSGPVHLIVAVGVDKVRAPQNYIQRKERTNNYSIKYYGVIVVKNVVFLLKG